MFLPRIKILLITDRVQYWIDEIKRTYRDNSALSLSTQEKYSLMAVGDCLQFYLVNDISKLDIDNRCHIVLLDKKVTEEMYEEKIAPFNCLSSIYFGDQGEITI